MKVTTWRKYIAIRRRFKKLYEVDRMRIDDVIGQLCSEYFVAEVTVWKVLRSDISEEESPEVIPENQLDLFEQKN